MAKNLSATPDLPFAESLSSRKPIRAAYEGHVWTRNKAALIARYLWHFLQVTKGGQYIDIFAGHQRKESCQETWAAKLALENCPSSRLRRLYLFEKDPKKLPALMELKRIHDKGWLRLSTRKVEVIAGDSNETLRTFFKRYPLKQTLPAFCLLDQWTRECHWRTVQEISKLKTRGCKVELFYFLAQGWMDRHWHIPGEKNRKRIEEWWGGSDWEEFRRLPSFERGQLMETRFRNELGYLDAQAFPIHKYGNHGRVMFWMIHASDDQRALPLMAKAYSEIGLNKRPQPLQQEDFLNRELL